MHRTKSQVGWFFVVKGKADEFENLVRQLEITLEQMSNVKYGKPHPKDVALCRELYLLAQSTASVADDLIKEQNGQAH